MSSSSLVHTRLGSEVCSCGFKFEPLPAYFEEEEDGREAKRGRLLIVHSDQLPEDVLVEILLNLPVKSLIRFTIVCKFWYDLIRSPKFMSLHDTNSKKKSVFLNCHSYNRGGNLTTTISFRSFDVVNVPLDLPLKLTVPLRVQLVQLVGCSNGIVCLSLTEWHHRVALWNPATRQSRLICLSRPRDAIGIYSGFFFDSIVNTCKLARVTFSEHQEIPFLMQPPKPEGTISGILNIFTLNDNKWRKKDLLVPSRNPRGGYMSPVTYLKTCMYWIVRGERGSYILRLDMVNELFMLIEMPRADRVSSDKKLFDYRGSLAMFVWNFLDSDPPCCCFDMWVFYDTNGTWCKLVTLRPSLTNVERPVGIFSKESVDLVLLRTTDQYLLWDKGSGETTKVIAGNGWVYPSFLYSESFASLY